MEKGSRTETGETIDCSKKEKRSVPLLSNRTNYSELPQHYVRPPTERPWLDEVVISFDSIPLVDLQGLLCDSTRADVIQQIGRACAGYGFFQIINHGIPDAVSSRMLRVAVEFFTMPVEDRMEYYSDDPFSKTRLSTSFNIHKEEVFNWRDYLRHHCYPLEDHVHSWPSKPAHYREVASIYCREVRVLALRLLEAISESLGLEADFLDKALGKHEQHMAINYYPKCPNPELTFGLPAHSDPTVLTLLLQDEVPGLQVFNNGHWISVNPIPNSFVVNIGDQLQVLSNGRYKSVLHRAVVSSSKARISIPTFYCPSPDAIIAPAPASIDNGHPALFRSFTYHEYYQKFWDRELQGNTCLQSFSLAHQQQQEYSQLLEHSTEEKGDI
eukprot:PITA_31080